MTSCNERERQALSSRGYYSLKEGEPTPIKPTKVVAYMVTEEDAETFSVGDVFTARNGQWYIKIASNDYRPWVWVSNS
jgi:hypothetical protein